MMVERNILICAPPPGDQNLRKRYRLESPYIVATTHLSEAMSYTGLKAPSPLSGSPEQAVESEKPNTSPSTRTQMPDSEVSIP